MKTSPRGANRLQLQADVLSSMSASQLGLQTGWTCKLNVQSSMSSSLETASIVQLHSAAMADLLQVYDLLMFNYVEDDDAMFR